MTPDTLVAEAGALFTLPDIALRINELSSDPATSIQALSEVILMDPGMSAMLLKLANSAYYGFPSRVDTVSQAATVVGQREIQNLAMAVSVIHTFKDIPEELVDMYVFWDLSVTCAVVARSLARKCHLANSERLFIAGLLHGIGKLVFYKTRPEQYRQVYQRVNDSHCALIQAEHEIFGFDHAALGGRLLAAWKLPEMLQVAVAYQAGPLDAPSNRKEAAIVHIAVDVAAGITPPAQGATPCRPYTPGFDPAAWSSLELSEDVLEGIIQEAPEKAFAILDIVNPRAGLIF